MENESAKLKDGWRGDGTIDLVYLICRQKGDSPALWIFGRLWMGMAVHGERGVETLLENIRETYGDVELAPWESMEERCSLMDRETPKKDLMSYGMNLGRVFKAIFYVDERETAWGNGGLADKLGMESGWVFGHEGAPPHKTDGEGWDAASRGACLLERLRLAKKSGEDVRGLATEMAVNEGRETGMGRDENPSETIMERLMTEGADPNSVLPKLMGSWYRDGHDHVAKEGPVRVLVHAGADTEVLWSPNSGKEGLSWFDTQSDFLSKGFRDSLIKKRVEWEKRSLSSEGCGGALPKRNRI